MRHIRSNVTMNFRSFYKSGTSYMSSDALTQFTWSNTVPFLDCGPRKKLGQFQLTFQSPF